MGMIGNSLAQGLISGANIQDGTVDTPDLKDGAVTSGKVASGAILPAKLSTGAPSWDSSGNLMIGTGTAGAPLSFTDSTALKIQFNANALNYYGVAKLAGGGTLGDGELRFTAGNTSGGAFTFSSGGSERVRFTSAGNVGVNMQSPSYKLVVGGGGGANGTNESLLQLYSATDANSNSVEMLFTPIISGQSRTAIGGVREGTGSTAALYFSTNNTERMRISGAGAVTVGGYQVLTNNPGTEDSYNQYTTMAAETWYKIGALPEAAGVYVCSVHMDGGNNSGGGSMYWESAWGFVIGAIGGNIYNAAPEQPIVVNGMYHHRNVSGEPSFKMDSGNEYDASYGRQSIWIKFPYITAVQGISFKYKRLL